MEKGIYTGSEVVGFTLDENKCVARFRELEKQGQERVLSKPFSLNLHTGGRFRWSSGQILPWSKLQRQEAGAGKEAEGLQPPPRQEGLGMESRERQRSGRAGKNFPSPRISRENEDVVPGALTSVGLATCRRDGVEGGGRGSSRDLGSQVGKLCFAGGQ